MTFVSTRKKTKSQLSSTDSQAWERYAEQPGSYVPVSPTGTTVVCECSSQKFGEAQRYHRDKSERGKHHGLWTALRMPWHFCKIIF